MQLMKSSEENKSITSSSRDLRMGPMRSLEKIDEDSNKFDSANKTANGNATAVITDSNTVPSSSKFESNIRIHNCDLIF